MSTIFTIIIFILVLGLLVLVHELGHFIVAKKSGVSVDEFGFGFPPRIFGKKIGDTIYSLNWIPLGGFVKIKGVAGDEEQISTTKRDPNSFATKSFSRKFFILFAGIFMNIVFAVVLFSLTFFIGVSTDPTTAERGAHISNQRVVLSAIIPNSPASESGLKPDDTILSINSQIINSAETFQQQITQKKEGEPSQLIIQRDQEKITIAVASQRIVYNEQSFIGIGVGLQDIATISYPWYQSIWEGIKTTGNATKQIFISLGLLVKNIFTQGKVGQDLAGPIGIAAITGEVARLGFVSLLQFMALLSINLGIFNLLPIPALDGGRIVFVIIEKIRKKPVNQKIEAIVHNIGFIFLLLLILLVTIKDISQYQLLQFLYRS